MARWRRFTPTSTESAITIGPSKPVGIGARRASSDHSAGQATASAIASHTRPGQYVLSGNGYLGLAGPSIGRSQRVAAFLGCLRKVDDGHRFYSESLRTDELGSASEL